VKNNFKRQFKKVIQMEKKYKIPSIGESDYRGSNHGICVPKRISEAQEQKKQRELFYSTHTNRK
jgi:hypothetical protein